MRREWRGNTITCLLFVMPSGYRVYALQFNAFGSCVMPSVAIVFRPRICIEGHEWLKCEATVIRVGVTHGATSRCSRHAIYQILHLTIIFLSFYYVEFKRGCTTSPVISFLSSPARQMHPQAETYDLAVFEELLHGISLPDMVLAIADGVEG